MFYLFVFTSFVLSFTKINQVGRREMCAAGSKPMKGSVRTLYCKVGECLKTFHRTTYSDTTSTRQAKRADSRIALQAVTMRIQKGVSLLSQLDCQGLAAFPRVHISTEIGRAHSRPSDNEDKERFHLIDDRCQRRWIQGGPFCFPKLVLIIQIPETPPSKTDIHLVHECILSLFWQTLLYQCSNHHTQQWNEQSPPRGKQPGRLQYGSWLRRKHGPKCRMTCR